MTPENNSNIDKMVADLQKLQQEFAHFIKVAEQSEGKLNQQRERTEQQVAQFSNELEELLYRIHESLKEVNSVMSDAGAARWRASAEKALQEGELHTKVLKELVQEFYEQAEKNFTRLERITVEIEKRIAKLFTTLSVEQNEVLEGFKKRSQDTYQEIDDISLSAAQSFKKTLNRVRIERAVIAIVVGFLAALLTGMYLNAEWPWESYHRSAQERQIGQAVLRNWAKLPEAQKIEIDRQLDLQMKE